MPSLEANPPSEFSQFRIEPQTDNLEKFESLNLSQEIPAINDDTTNDVPVLEEEIVMNDIDNIQPAKLENIFKQKSGDTFSTDKKVNAKSAITTTQGLNDSEIEAIVRAHTEEFIKTQLKDSLLMIVEKIVREELNKVLEEEVRLKQELLDDNP